MLSNQIEGKRVLGGSGWWELMGGRNLGASAGVLESLLLPLGRETEGSTLDSCLTRTVREGGFPQQD